ncbi:hypothetical protein HDU97_001101 [Phlyctochytrium planicorne]|nr:hypothetical protein HDU97_001101 [Phlyctochytrium planicorne]
MERTLVKPSTRHIFPTTPTTHIPPKPKPPNALINSHNTTTPHPTQPLPNNTPEHRYVHNDIPKRTPRKRNVHINDHSFPIRGIGRMESRDPNNRRGELVVGNVDIDGNASVLYPECESAATARTLNLPPTPPQNTDPTPPNDTEMTLEDVTLPLKLKRYLQGLSPYLQDPRLGIIEKLLQQRNHLPHGCDLDPMLVINARYRLGDRAKHPSASQSYLHFNLVYADFKSPETDLESEWRADPKDPMQMDVTPKPFKVYRINWKDRNCTQVEGFKEITELNVDLARVYFKDSDAKAGTFVSYYFQSWDGSRPIASGVSIVFDVLNRADKKRGNKKEGEVLGAAKKGKSGKKRKFDVSVPPGDEDEKCDMDFGDPFSPALPIASPAPIFVNKENATQVEDATRVVEAAKSNQNKADERARHSSPQPSSSFSFLDALQSELSKGYQKGAVAMDEDSEKSTNQPPPPAPPAPAVQPLPQPYRSQQAGPVNWAPSKAQGTPVWQLIQQQIQGHQQQQQQQKVVASAKKKSASADVVVLDQMIESATVKAEAKEEMAVAGASSSPKPLPMPPKPVRYSAPSLAAVPPPPPAAGGGQVQYMALPTAPAAAPPAPSAQVQVAPIYATSQPIYGQRMPVSTFGYGAPSYGPPAYSGQQQQQIPQYMPGPGRAPSYVQSVYSNAQSAYSNVISVASSQSYYGPSPTVVPRPTSEVSSPPAMMDHSMSPEPSGREDDEMMELDDAGGGGGAVDDLRSPIHRVSELGLTRQVEDLVSEGADVNLAEGKDGWRPMHFAALNGHVETLKFLIDQGADANAVDFKGMTPMHVAAVNGRTAFIRELAGRGGAVNGADNHGRQPLHLAVQGRRLDPILALIEVKADVNGKDRNGRTPLSIAYFNEDATTIEVLKAAGALETSTVTLDATSRSPLHLATELGRAHEVESILKAGADVNAPEGNDGWRAIHFACLNGHLKPLQILISYGADVRVPDARGLSPLHVASLHGRTLLIEELIRHGAEVNVADGRGRKPIHLAARGGRADPIKALLEAKADVDAIDGEGRSPLAMAYIYHQGQAIEVLTQAGAKDRDVLEMSLGSEGDKDKNARKQRWMQSLGKMFKFNNVGGGQKPPAKRFTTVPSM